jgi:CBS domain-containing protein
MPTARDLLARKRGEVISISPSDTALHAAQVMNQHGIGGLVVLEQGALLGVFTERDILRRVVASGRDPAGTLVREVMTSPVMTCLPDTSVEECGAIMSKRRIRHLPVTDDRGLVGLVTSGDLLAFQVAEQSATIQYLNSYMFDVR